MSFMQHVNVKTNEWQTSNEYNRDVTNSFLGSVTNVTDLI